MNKTVALVLLVLVLAGGVYYLRQNNAVPAESMQQAMPADQSVGVTEMMVEPSGAMMEAKKSFTVNGSNFTFDVKEMMVKKGDMVEVTFTNMDGTHDWKLDEFNVATKMLKTGESETVTFVADQVGTFEYYCSVGQHRQNGMVGKLIVTE